MLQAEDDLLHRESTFANDPRGIEQYQTTHQAQYQVAVVCLFALHLTGSRRQQVLQGPKTVLDPVAPLPCPDEPRPADSGFEAHDVELLLLRLTDHDEYHGAIRWAGRPQPRIAHPRDLLAVPPGPIALVLQVVALDLPSIGQCEGVGTLPFHKERALVGRGHMAHELRI